MPGAGAGGSASPANLGVAAPSARAGQGDTVCWLFRTRCSLLSEHYRAVGGVCGVCMAVGKGAERPLQWEGVHRVSCAPTLGKNLL